VLRACLISTVRLGERPLGELDATRRWLAEHERCTGRVGVIGFCMGGDFALTMAPRRGVSAASVNYGGATEAVERALPDPAELPLWVKAIARLANAGYHEESARDARRRIIAFFRAHLADDERVEERAPREPGEDRTVSAPCDRSDERRPKAEVERRERRGSLVHSRHESAGCRAPAAFSSSWPWAMQALLRSISRPP
jgi:Dienelactone hydrolase family